MSKVPAQDLAGFDQRALEVKLDREYVEPAAWALGVVTIDRGVVVDPWFPYVNLRENIGSSAILFGASSQTHEGAPRFIERKALKKQVLPYFASFKGDGEPHPNIDAIKAVYKASRGNLGYGRTYQPVLVFIPDLLADPDGMLDACLRLALLGQLKVVPNEVNIADIFKQLPIVAWTNYGPFLGDPERMVDARVEVMRDGGYLDVLGLDKFGKLLNNTIPERVRVADATRVRNGAHLAPGTTVMQTGFVNYNAGTLGDAMIEGSVSQGSTIGAGSDVGRGAGLIGNLSGGGKGNNSIGEGSLLGALSEIDISIGKNCIVASGTVVMSGTKVVLHELNGRVTESLKAIELEDRDNLLFRTNSETGAVEVIELKEGEKAKTLNPMLHA